MARNYYSNSYGRDEDYEDRGRSHSGRGDRQDYGSFNPEQRTGYGRDYAYGDYSGEGYAGGWEDRANRQRVGYAGHQRRSNYDHYGSSYNRELPYGGSGLRDDSDDDRDYRRYGNDFGGHRRDYDRDNYGDEARDRYDYGRDRRYGLGASAAYGARGGYYRQDYDYARDRDERGRDRRDWWDRAGDEVASWFGDDEAERRRRRDERRGGYRGQGPKGYRRSDERIREEVSDRLSDNDYLNASNIEVSAEEGNVILSGSVYFRSDKRLAEELAEGVSGVQNVENRLRISERGAHTSDDYQNALNRGRSTTKTDSETTSEQARTTTTGNRNT